MHIDKFTSDVSHAGDLCYSAGSIKIVEPGITIRMHKPFILAQMLVWPLTLPVGRELIP